MTQMMAPAGAPPPARSTNKWLVAVAVALGALLEVIDTSIVNVALTEMQNAYGATLSQIGWVVSSYAVANVIILPLTAWLGERFGKKRYFVFSLVAFTLASVLCGAATSLPMLIAARVLQGLGGGGLLAKAQAILFETFPKEEQPLAQGLFGAVVISGPAIGPTLGGYIVTNSDWRWIFFINIPVGIAAVLLCAFALPADRERDEAPAAIDWLSIALLALGLGCLQTMLEEGNADDWFESPFIVAMAAAAAAGLVLFIVRQLRAAHPVVDLRVLRHRSLWAGSILSIVVGMALYGAMFAVPIFAQSIMRYTSQQTGMLMLPGALASAFGMVLASALVRRFDPRALFICGALVLTGSVIQLSHISPQTGADDLFWPLIVRSIGTVLMFLPLNMATLGPIPTHEVGKAAGFFSLTRQLGGSIGVAVLTTVLSQRQAFHRGMLVEGLSPGDPQVQARLGLMAAAFRGQDAGTAHDRAVAMLDQIVNLQSAVMSFGDTFWVTAAVILCTLPLVLLLGKGAGKLDAGAAH